MTVTFQLWFGGENVSYRFKHRDGRCAFVLLRALKKQPARPSGEQSFLQQTWGPCPCGTLVVIMECGSNSRTVQGEPGGPGASWQALLANRFRQPMEKPLSG